MQRDPLPVLVQIWGNPLITISDRDVIGDAIRSCGGVNVAGSLPGAASRVSIESVLALQPQLVVATDSPQAERRWREVGLPRMHALFRRGAVRPTPGLSLPRRPGLPPATRRARWANRARLVPGWDR